MLDSSTVNEMWDSSIARSFNGNVPKEKGDNFVFVDLKNKVIVCGSGFEISKS